MPSFEEILQASKFISKISEMRGPCPKVSYFNAVITVITDHKKSEKIVYKSPHYTGVQNITWTMVCSEWIWNMSFKVLGTHWHFIAIVMTLFIYVLPNIFFM